jgi:twinkle protein
MNVIDDLHIDFDAYLKGPDEGAKVRPASDWLDATIEAFRRPVGMSGAKLPWSKTENIVRLRHGEFSVWPGMNGHGKSMLVNQVVLSLLAQGEKVCICSMEMKPHETMQRMCRQAYGTSAPSIGQIKDLHRWTDGRLWLYDQQGQVTPDRVIAVARYCHEEVGINHLVVDNLLSCGIAEDDYNGQKAFALSLATHAHDTRQAIHLLAHSRKGKDELAPPGKYDVRGSASITDLADNVFTVWRNKAKERAIDEGRAGMDYDPDCLLIVDKHRHGEWEGRIQLWFNKGSQSYQENQGQAPHAMRLLSDDAEVEF